MFKNAKPIKATFGMLIMLMAFVLSFAVHAAKPLKGDDLAAAIADLQADLAAPQAQVDVIGPGYDNTALQATVANLQGRATTIEGQVDDLQNQANDLQLQIENIGPHTPQYDDSGLQAQIGDINALIDTIFSKTVFLTSGTE